MVTRVFWEHKSVGSNPSFPKNSEVTEWFKVFVLKINICLHIAGSNPVLAVEDGYLSI